MKTILTEHLQKAFELFEGGTGFGGNGANIKWNEFGNTIGHGVAALGSGLTAVGLLAAPEPTGLTKVLGVTALVGSGYEVSQEWDSSKNFNRSIDAASRLYLDQGPSQFVP